MMSANEPIVDMPLRKIDHVKFFVGNARQSAYFYRNAYGFDVVLMQGWKPRSSMKQVTS